MQLCKHFLYPTSSDWIEFHEYFTPYNALLLVCEFHEHITPYNVFLLVWNQDTWFLMTHTWSYQLSTAVFFLSDFTNNFVISCFICTVSSVIDYSLTASVQSGWFVHGTVRSQIIQVISLSIVIYFSLAAK